MDRLVVFGSNAYINDQDIEMINQVEDISAWSERYRKKASIIDSFSNSMYLYG